MRLCLTNGSDGARMQLYSATNIIVFWDMTTCSVVNHYEYFGGTSFFRALGKDTAIPVTDREGP
jgi:hypothetical protein